MRNAILLSQTETFTGFISIHVWRKQFFLFVSEDSIQMKDPRGDIFTDEHYIAVIDTLHAGPNIIDPIVTTNKNANEKKSRNPTSMKRAKHRTMTTLYTGLRITLG